MPTTTDHTATANEIVGELHGLEADLRAYREFCNPHPLGRRVSRVILEELDPAIRSVFTARKALVRATGGRTPVKAEPSTGITFEYRDFDFLATIAERETRIENLVDEIRFTDDAETTLPDVFADALEQTVEATGSVSDFRGGFRHTYKYAEEISAGIC